jgi:NodT family efflux transporter outer membrane factor (OMF) lipoprotein
MPQIPLSPSPLARTSLRVLLVTAAAAALCACAVGPNYARPPAAAAPAFKEPAHAPGWSPAQPADTALKADWWTLFDDPVLNELEARVAVSNQNVAAAEAAYRQAEALVREQKAALFPSLSLNPSGARSGSGGSGGGIISTPGGGVVSTGSGKASSTYRASLAASWEPDVWGRIRREVESAGANAQSSAADLAAARLSAQGALATDYFDLRELDAETALLQATVEGYQQSLKIAQNRFNAGAAPHSDVLQAQSQLASTQADLADLGRQRAAFEHAIAVLTGQAPETFALGAQPSWNPSIPEVPAGVPSELLQRRPDVAAAERRAAAASAQIGVATAAYFPSLTLTGSYGYSAGELGSLFSASSSLWSYGLSAAETLFDGGLRKAQVSAARASYDQTVAQYRQAALTAFQNVEDQLAATRVLAAEYELRRQSALASEQAAQMVVNQYRAGQVVYTNVVTAQATALSARRGLAQAAASRQTTAVALIQGLGGGWAGPSPGHP